MLKPQSTRRDDPHPGPGNQRSGGGESVAALSEITGRDHTHLALNKEDEKIRFRDIQAQPRKIISSPTWSGLEDEHVSYNAGYTNVHELIPWRTLLDVSRCIRITSGCAISVKACWSIVRRSTPVR